MKILLTAPPGLGKSTVIDSVTRAFAGEKCGIVAKELLDKTGKRIGFTSVNTAGQSKQFMSLADPPGTGSIGGEFNVDVDAVDNFVVPELRKGLAQPHGLIYVDEIGRAQSKSNAFLSVLREILKADCNLLGAIVYDDEPWSMEFKTNPSICILELTEQNRDELPGILNAAFESSSLFSTLSDREQQLVYKLFAELIADRQFVSARKLFANAIHYVIGKKVQFKARRGVCTEYEVAGNVRNHTVVHKSDNGTFDCDCDLANGKGMYANRPERCSHELSILLTLRAAPI